MDREEILRLYFENRVQNGTLYIDQISPNIDKGERIQTLDIGGKKYFLKLDVKSTDNRNRRLSKNDINAEVFASFLYQKHGLRGATYVPIKALGRRGVLSDDVVDNGFIDGNMFFSCLKEINFQNHKNSQEKSHNQLCNLPDFWTNINGEKNFNLLLHCSNDAGRDIVKTSALDFVLKNSDRRPPNYFVGARLLVNEKTISKELFFDNVKRNIKLIDTLAERNNGNVDLLIDEFRFIDNEFSSYNMHGDKVLDARNYYSPIFDRGDDCLEKNFAIRKMMSNDLVGKFMPPEEIVEFVESVDLKKTKEEVEDTFKLKIEDSYMDNINYSYDTVLREMDKVVENKDCEE